MAIGYISMFGINLYVVTERPTQEVHFDYLLCFNDWEKDRKINGHFKEDTQTIYIDGLLHVFDCTCCLCRKMVQWVHLIKE